MAGLAPLLQAERRWESAWLRVDHVQRSARGAFFKQAGKVQGPNLDLLLVAVPIAAQQVVS